MKKDLTLQAGCATADITPVDSQFLSGYPHVPRWSTGVHDPLTSSALALDNGKKRLLIIANDILYVQKYIVANARKRIEAATQTPAANIMITATHTHSGPTVSNRSAGSYSSVVPDADPAYLQLLEDGIVEAGIAACKNLRPAEVGLAIATVEGIGTNRRDPAGPADPEIPVFAVRDPATKELFGIMELYSMHPTVLHEDSKLVSGDFPAMARRYLQEKFGPIPVLHHMGAAGNQSPRHCVRGQTFDEAIRLGTIMGRAIEEALGRIEYRDYLEMDVISNSIEYPQRDLPTVADASAKVDAVRAKFERQQQDGTPRAIVRTTECDLFGAEASLSLARAKELGGIEERLAGCMPAEIQVMALGPWRYIGWQGEVFIERSLAIRATNPNIFVATCANGTMAGYITTSEAVAEGGYEASTSVFKSESGDLLVQESLKLVEKLAAIA